MSIRSIAQGRDSRRLIMRAGSGEAGRTMWSADIPLGWTSGSALVAQAARTGEIVRVDDVTSSPAHSVQPRYRKTCSRLLSRWSRVTR